MDGPSTILITAFGTSNARAIASIIEDRFPMVKVIATDSNELTSLTPHPFVNKLLRVPPASDTTYVQRIKEICHTEKPDFLIPIFDDEVIKIAGAREELMNLGVHTFLPESEVLEICRDKFKFFQFGMQHGLPMIDSSLNPDFAYPMFMKPRRGNGSKGCFQVNDADEVRVLSKRITGEFYQKFESGRVMDVDFVSDHHGEVLVSVIKEELETKNGIGVKVKIVEHAGIQKELRRLVRALKYRGIGAVEFFLNGDDVKIIEVNIRPSSGIIFSYKAGGDFLGQCFSAAGFSNIILQESRIRENVRMNRELEVYEL